MIKKMIAAILAALIALGGGVYFSHDGHDLVKVWDAANKTVIIGTAEGVPLLTIEQVSHKPDICTCEEVLNVTSYVNYKLNHLKDFRARWQRFKGKNNITKVDWHILKNESYQVIVDDYGKIEHNQIIPNIIFYENITDTWTESCGCVVGDYNSMEKWNITRQTMNGTESGIVCFDRKEVLQVKPLKVKVYWNMTDVIGNHDETRYHDVWKSFSPVGKTIHANKTYTVRLTFHKPPEVGDVSIQTIPMFRGVECDELTWWNTSWDNKREIKINNTGGSALTYYQVNGDLTSTPINSTSLRVVNETANATVPHWQETISSGNCTDLWFNTTSIPASAWLNGTYYIYYGNAEAVNDWDGDTTFSFFDDFPGVSLDADKWELVNTPDITVSGGILTIDNNAVSEYIRSKTYTTAYGKAIRTRERDYTASYYPGLFAFGERTSGTDVNHVSKIVYTADQYTLACNDGVGSEVMSSGNAVDDSYHLWDLTWLSDEVKLIKDGAQDEILTTEIPSASLKIVLGGRTLGGSYYGNSQGSFDWVFVRKYVTNPPTYTFGSEEAVSYMPPTPISLMNITGNFWINHTWSPGSSNVTNSYNVSVNNVWHNTSPAYYNDTYAPHAWQNITVWAYNSTGTGTLSTGSINQNTQIPNNPITITNTSDWNGDAGEVVYVDYDATDIDSDTATFSCDRTDLFTDFDTTTGTGNWTATANIYYVDFGVSDGYGSISNYTMALTESSMEITLLDELKLIMSEIITELKSINMSNYLVYAFILIGILFIILLIQLLNNCIYRG